MSTSEALTDYYERISKQPILSVEEEKELVNTIYYKDCSTAEKKRAKDRLLTANLRFVFQAARRRSKRGDTHQFEELVSLGNEGLMKGLEKYNPAMGVRFLSYAGWWVMQHQLKGQASMRLVSLPLWKQQLAALIAKEVDAKGSVLTEEELEIAFPMHKVKDLLDLQSCKYLTNYLDDYEDDTFLTTPMEEDILEIVEKEDLIRKVMSLSDPYSEVLMSYYGLHGHDKIHIADIAKKLGMSPQKVRRTIPRAIKLLQGLYLGVAIV